MIEFTVLARLNPRIIKVIRPMRGSKEIVFPWGVRFEGLKLNSGARWGVACGGKKSREPSGGFRSESPGLSRTLLDQLNSYVYAFSAS